MGSNERVTWRTLAAFVGLVVVIAGAVFYQKWDEKRRQREHDIERCMAHQPPFVDARGRCMAIIDAVDLVEREKQR